jgi:CubicO group peptidase (beta-lactamase class C family)
MSSTRMPLVVVLALGLAATAPGQQGPPFVDNRTIPDTPACKRALEIVGLLASFDVAKVRLYVQRDFAPVLRDAASLERHVAILAGLHDQAAGQFEVYAARTYEPPRPDRHAVIIVRNNLAESWQAFVVEVEPDAPHRVTSLRLDRARPPRDLPVGERLTTAQIAQKLDAYVAKLARADAFSGTVLLAKDGEVALTKAVGIANRDFDAPVSIDTKFNLGSMNKMFTGVAAVQLVEQGKLSLDDPIGKHLDETWCAADVLAKVKVKHLLTHTSGLGSYFNRDFDRSSRALFRNVEDYKPLVRDETLSFEPGTRWSYSNTGMLLAGAVIERASGTDYFDYVRAHVTGPAGMTSTDCYELDRVNRNLAVGYEKERAPDGTVFLRNNLFMHVIRGGPAGGGYSTVQDLLRFDRALREGKLASRASLDQLWSPHPEVGAPLYGYGFSVETTPVGRVVGHGGGFNGISAQLSMYLDEGYTVAVMANYGGAAPLVEQRARDLILQGR